MLWRVQFEIELVIELKGCQRQRDLCFVHNRLYINRNEFMVSNSMFEIASNCFQFNNSDTIYRFCNRLMSKYLTKPSHYLQTESPFWLRPLKRKNVGFSKCTTNLRHYIRWSTIKKLISQVERTLKIRVGLSGVTYILTLEILCTYTFKIYLILDTHVKKYGFLYNFKINII